MLPSPIGASNSAEAEDDFMKTEKKRPHEGSNNNATNDFSGANSTIHRSVTTDDDNVAAPSNNSGNADFSTAILLGSTSASNQIKRVAAPTSSSYGAPKRLSIPTNVPHGDIPPDQMQTFARAAVPSAIAAGGPPQPSGPTPLMSTTSPLQRQPVHTKSSNLDTTTVTAAVSGKQDAAPTAATDEAFVEKWTCDVCKSRTFDTYEDASQHEISCKILHDAKKKKEQEGSLFPWEDPAAQQQKKEEEEAEADPPKRKRRKKKAATHDQELHETAGALTNLALTTNATTSNPPSSSMQMALPSAAAPPHGRHPTLTLIPSANRSNVLSEYNHMLVRNIEFFYPASSHLDYDNLSGSMNGSLMSQNRLGLRCIHCKDSRVHVTAAAFFPRTVGSIASGLGTIGTRHFGWGKCPFVNPELVQDMVEAKKTSSNETRARGKMGLDAYCRDLASRCGVYDDELSGICWEEGTIPIDSIPVPELPSITSSSNNMETDRDAVAALLAGMKSSTNIEKRSFIPTTTEHFWECNGCRTVPLEFRAKGSVVFSVNEPSNDQVARHLQICNGNKPLVIPTHATIAPFYGEQVPPIKVSWDSGREYSSSSSLVHTAASVAPSSGRSTRRRSTSSSNVSSEKSSNVSVKSGTEEGLLCSEDDKEFTTDFAYFTVTQLKKCYLTKAGGSRGSCPLGYPGLACGFCAGTETERRFFYTSADHLRNSFSHIPSHMAECSLCPQEVKTRLEELKALRNSQKSSLKPGYHKIFIDRVWQNLHAGGNGRIDRDEEEQEMQAPSLVSGTASMEGSERIGTRLQSSNQQQQATVDALVMDEDKPLTSDLIFYTLQQLEPYKPRQSKSDDDDDEQEREIGFPGLECRHCRHKSDGRKFFTTSSEHLSDLLLTISNHVGICRDCPVSVRTQMVGYQFTHESQLESLAGGVSGHRAYMEEVWRRLSVLSQEKRRNPSRSRRKLASLPVAPANYPMYAPSNNEQLVTPEDEHLVTPFTFFVMSQMRPCNLDLKENGSRSNFSHGFPGLECMHCQGPQSRKFFYRSAEILGGNYSHIPNHLSTCSMAPPGLSQHIAQLKQHHKTEKHNLDRGAQKTFFNSVWARLHGEVGADAEAEGVGGNIEASTSIHGENDVGANDYYAEV